jgi:hypothetical protein
METTKKGLSNMENLIKKSNEDHQKISDNQLAPETPNYKKV